MIFMDKMIVTGDIFPFPKITVWCDVLLWVTARYTKRIHNYSKNTIAGNIIKTLAIPIMNQ